MADAGYSYDTLVASLSAIGAASGALISLSVTGRENKVVPLVDYGDFSQHVFFTDAVRLFNTSFNLAGEVICHAVDDAYNILHKSSMNYLYLPEKNVCLRY